MGLSFVEVLPEIKIPASMIFSHPTALGDTLRPAIERIFLPEEYLHPLQVKIDVKTGQTGPRKPGSQRSKIYKALCKAVKGTQVLDYPEKFLFDGRQELDTNIGHVIENLAAPALLAKQMLSKRLGQDVDVHVVLRERAPNLAREVFATLGIPVIYTDDSVYGEVISMSVARPTTAVSTEAPQFFPIINQHLVAEIDSKLYNLHAALFNEAEFAGCEPLGVEKVFIPRRGNRCLINNDEVVQFLEGKGFKTYYFEDLTCAQKWSITRDVKVVVAVHGAALSHMAFNRLGLQNPELPNSGVKVVELYSPGWSSRWAHRRHISGLNGQWCGVRGQVTPEFLKTIDFPKLPNGIIRPSPNSFKIDCASLQMALDYLDA
ncbi:MULTISPECIES: glycosyltransferase family 61 protein [Cyanophyceae]|uniref:Glycosyltransferase family 61 protein n=1 Tax=Leptolyngbya subtilissima DQ-A4 TaxID=2933933 RepID=A0ABV0KAH7_9CYAN|nr:glycosyltransferase family 61 protein [Nodosilinea sp. FACHB-141]MBD2113750.1 glycosyltransferase family 61 protein [Nodosilinea sp. FACHB-141]